MNPVSLRSKSSNNLTEPHTVSPQTTVSECLKQLVDFDALMSRDTLQNQHQ
jgi:hypothetical protein